MSSAVTAARSWLDTRQAGVPQALWDAVIRAIEQVGETQPNPEAVLRGAADRLLAETVRDEGRTDPVGLLAADALITYVCEYRSECEPDMLETLL